MFSCNSEREHEVTISTFADSVEQYLNQNDIHFPDVSLKLEAMKSNTSRFCFSPFEFSELRKHLSAAVHERFSAEEQEKNILSILDYKVGNELVEYLEREKYSKEELSEKFEKLSGKAFWENAFVEDRYVGNSDFFVVLIPQIHEVNITEEELLTVIPVQDNILEMQEKLLKNGAQLFVYEGMTLKEMAKELPTKLSRDSIYRYYSKKLECEFENSNPEVISYGIETKSVHVNTDTLRSVYWFYKTLLDKYEKKFPIDWWQLTEVRKEYFMECKSSYDVNFRFLSEKNYETLHFASEGKISATQFKTRFDSLGNILLDRMLNERNNEFVKNIETVYSATGKQIIVLKAGTSHFERLDVLSDYPDFELITIQDILKKKKISYIYLVPYYVWHFNL